MVWSSVVIFPWAGRWSLLSQLDLEYFPDWQSEIMCVLCRLTCLWSLAYMVYRITCTKPYCQFVFGLKDDGNVFICLFFEGCNNPDSIFPFFLFTCCNNNSWRLISLTSIIDRCIEVCIWFILFCSVLICFQTSYVLNLPCSVPSVVPSLLFIDYFLSFNSLLITPRFI